MIKQLSIFGSLLTCVNFNNRLVPKPIITPMNKLPKNTIKNMPMLSKKLKGVKVPTEASLYFRAVSKSTIAIASFKMLSPKMTVYSFGSTLYVLKIARIVTGSVAERVAPTDMASTKLMSSPSSGMRVHRYRMMPRTRAEMKVPAKAKVRMVPMLRKKLP